MLMKNEETVIQSLQVIILYVLTNKKVYQKIKNTVKHTLLVPNNYKLNAES
jgi:hypothetical protein